MSLACSWDREIDQSQVKSVCMCSIIILSYVHQKTILANRRMQIAHKIFKRNIERGVEAQQPKSTTRIVIQDLSRENCNARLFQKIFLQLSMDINTSFCTVDPKQSTDASADRGVVDTAATHHCRFCEGTVTLYLYPVNQSLGEVGPKERRCTITYDGTAKKPGKVIIQHLQLLHHRGSSASEDEIPHRLRREFHCCIAKGLLWCL